jgi:peptidoglycan hydrolase-like protein with peptidoglycan-binding domain
MREQAFVDDDASCGCAEQLTALDTGRAAPPHHDAALSDTVRVEIRPSEIVIRIRTDSADVSMIDARDADVRGADIRDADGREHDDVPLLSAAKALARAVPGSRAGPGFVGFAVGSADKYRDGYSQIQLRKDLVDSYTAALQHVHALGGLLTSSGAIRDLTERATAGRSTTSLHYTGRALDLFIYSGMQGSEDPYLVTRAGGTDANPEWEVFCVSKAPLTASPLFDPSLIAERDVECVRWVRGVGSRTFVRRAVCFSLTDVMARHGWAPIPARGAWKGDYLSCEWWHFQNAAGLVDNASTFGEQLRQVWREELVRDSGLALGAVWAGRSFHASGVVVAPAPTEPARELVIWAQAVLNAVAGAGLPAEGDYGPRTKAALRGFQTANSIPITGALDATTEITLLQRALGRLQQATFTHIGVNTDDTVRAVTEFQRAHALKPDGDAGPRTRAAMVALLARSPRSRAKTAAKKNGAGAVAPGKRRGAKRHTASTSRR